MKADTKIIHENDFKHKKATQTIKKHMKMINTTTKTKTEAKFDIAYA